MSEIGKIFFVFLIILPLAALLGFMVYVLFYNWLDKASPTNTNHSR